MRKTLAVLILAIALVSCGGGNAGAPAEACDSCKVDSIAHPGDSVVLEK